MLSTPVFLTPDFKICHLLLSIPNVHSMSFLINLIHFDHHVWSILFVIKKGGTVQDHGRYPLSIITYPPVYVVVTILPSPSYDRRLNLLLLRNFHHVYHWELVKMHHCLVFPMTQTTIGRMKDTTLMVARQVECTSSVAALSTKMIVFQTMLTPLVIICVQSDETMQPGNPLSPYSSMFDFASSRCTKISTHFACRMVLPNSMRTWKKVQRTSCNMGIFFSISLNVQPQPR